MDKILNYCLCLLLKVYTIDKFYKKVVTVGHAALNVFVAAGTNRQPKVDTGGVQVYSIVSSGST